MSLSDKSNLSTPIGCPADALMKLLAKEWTTHIIWRLRVNGTTRFGALRRSLPGPISARVLSVRLKELEGLGLIRRRAIGDKILQVEYTLTEKGLVIDADIRQFEQSLEID